MPYTAGYADIGANERLHMLQPSRQRFYFIYPVCRFRVNASFSTVLFGDALEMDSAFCCIVIWNTADLDMQSCTYGYTGG